MGTALTPDLSSQLLSGARLERLFAACFSRDFNTVLTGGAAEPLFSPAKGNQPVSIIYYREDYFASALHEVAHWCIAGAARRQQLDFGYWYAPDGRTAQQQRAFERVESKPQALEWFFSKACGARFTLSADNLHGLAGDADDRWDFERKVLAQVQTWQRVGLPLRAQTFFQALCLEFGTDIKPDQLEFTLTELT